jgi:excisionase family DNA binding protein
VSRTVTKAFYAMIKMLNKNAHVYILLVGIVKLKNVMPEYLTIKQASEILQVHPNTLRNWDKNGMLKAVRIGVRKDRRYKRQDVLKLLNEGVDDDRE